MPSFPAVHSSLAKTPVQCCVRGAMFSTGSFPNIWSEVIIAAFARLAVIIASRQNRFSALWLTMTGSAAGSLAALGIRLKKSQSDMVPPVCPSGGPDLGRIPANYFSAGAF